MLKHQPLPPTKTRKITLDELIPPNFDDVFADALHHRHTHYVFKGGRGSCKSSVVGLLLVLLLVQPQNADKHALVFRKTAATLRDSVFAQVQFAIGQLGLDSEFRCTTNPMQITYTRTGQRIVFRGVDDKLKLKSLKAPFGYYAFTWLEESDTFSGMEEIRSILQSAMRGGKDFWVFYSFNPPISKSNFMNEEVLRQRSDRVVHHSDYRTVPVDWLGEAFLEEARQLQESNPRAYEHEYLGIPTGTGGEVFENITLRPITNEEIDGFDYVFYGLDFGWYPDPTHWVKVAYSAKNRKLFIFDELRMVKTSNREIWQRLLDEKGMTGEDLLMADSAEPKSVADLHDFGALCRGVVKGPDSVRYSIKWLQSMTEIVIDPDRCPFSAKEFTDYEYERTADGEIVSAYPDADNHAIDAVRYAMNPVWRRKGQ